jgi:hypothetical protein
MSAILSTSANLQYPSDEVKVGVSVVWSWMTDSRTCKTRVQVGVENDVARLDVSVHDYGLENGRIGSMKVLETFDCTEEHR